MRGIARFSVLAAFVFVVGCAGDWGTASGTVTLDGQALEKGDVTFEPTGGGATAYATIHKDGSYRIMTGAVEGLKPGEYVVTVVDQTIPKNTDENAKILTPVKYASAKTTDLKVTITSGRNTVPLVLKK